jgi:hypothetical protein
MNKPTLSNDEQNKYLVYVLACLIGGPVLALLVALPGILCALGRWLFKVKPSERWPGRD